MDNLTPILTLALLWNCFFSKPPNFSCTEAEVALIIHVTCLLLSIPCLSVSSLDYPFFFLLGLGGRDGTQ